MRESYQESLNTILTRVVAHEEDARNVGAVEFSKVFGQLRKTWIFYRYLVERGTTKKAPTGVQILYAKISNCLVSILHLLQQGYPGPAAMVLRSLFEAHINLSIILEKDTAERSKLFEDFIHIEREYTYSMVGASEQVRRQHQQDLAAVRIQYHPDKPRSWCWKIVPSKGKGKGGIPNNPTFRDLCEYLGELEAYDTLYGRDSAAIHTVPSYELWLRRAEGGPMELGPQFSSRTESVGKMSIAFGISTFVAVVFFLKPDDATQLAEFTAKETTDWSQSGN